MTEQTSVGIGIVKDNDYVDTTMTTQTPMVSFEGFSLTIKKKSVKIMYSMYMGVFTYPIELI